MKNQTRAFLAEKKNTRWMNSMGDTWQVSQNATLAINHRLGPFDNITSIKRKMRPVIDKKGNNENR